eukprot:COSAG02_NODE_13794_length_1347_cov_0.897436_2_plen_167_part_00
MQNEIEVKLLADVASLRDAHSTRIDGLDQQLQDDRQQFVDLCSRLDQTSKENYEHFTNLCITMDEKTTESISGVGVKLENQQQHFTAVCANLDQKFMEKTSAMDSRTENQRLHLLDLCEDLAIQPLVLSFVLLRQFGYCCTNGRGMSRAPLVDCFGGFSEMPVLIF